MALGMFGTRILGGLMGVVIAMSGAASAGQPATPVPTAGGPLYCPIEVATVLPVKGASDPTRTFAFFFVARRGDGHKTSASGKLVVYDKDDRYEVPFHDAIAVTREVDLVGAMPIVVHFPADVQPTAAYVGALAGPADVECTIFSPWAPETGHAALSKGEVDSAKLQTVASGVAPVDAEPPVQVSPPACRHPNESARFIAGPAPEFPEDLHGQSGVAVVVVSLRADAAIFDAQIYLSSGFAGFDNATLVAAERSTFRAERYRCVPVSGVYFFRADFHS